MRGVLTATLCLLLVACASGPPIGADPGRGIIVLGLDRAEELGATPFVAELMAINSAGRVEPLFTRTRRHAAIQLPSKRLFDGSPSTRFALDVEPGEYMLAKIGIGLDDTPKSIWPRSRSEVVNDELGRGIAFLAKKAQEASDGWPIEYVKDGIPAANAPRFTVRPGEVVYIGDILIGAEYRQSPAEPERTPDERNRPGGTVYRHTKLFAEYALDVPAARQFAASIGVGQRSFRTQPIRLSDADRTLFPNESKPPRDASLLTVVRARQASTATPIGLVAQPAAAPGRAPPGVPSLMERFLAGEITAEQYKAAAAGP